MSDEPPNGIIEKMMLENARDRACRDAEIERLRALIQTLLDNDPNDMAADAVTVLEVWRKEAREVLGQKEAADVSNS